MTQLLKEWHFIFKLLLLQLNKNSNNNQELCILIHSFVCLFQLFANIYFKLGPPTLSELDRERCRDLFERHFAEFPDDSFANIQTIGKKIMNFI